MSNHGNDHWIWTMGIQQWRYAKTLDIPMYDITVKSGIKAFAPNWDFLMAYKNGEIGIAEYTRYYHQKVIGSINDNLPLWDQFLNEPKIILACYCKPGDFCHRYLLTNLLVHYLQDKGRSVTYQGELLPPGHPSNNSI